MSEESDDLTRLVLRAGQPVRWPEEIQVAIAEFVPLAYEAGERAAKWLKSQAGTATLPLDLYLVLDATSEALLGFFVIEPETVVISSGDAPVVQVRTGIQNPAEEQSSSLLVWMARSQQSNAGFGETLFDDVIDDAKDRGARLIRVSPADEPTEERIWVDRFRFRRPRHDRDGEWVFLWYAIGDPDQSFG